MLGFNPKFQRFAAISIIALSVLGSIGFFWWKTTRSSEISFLPRISGAEWMIYPSAQTPAIHPIAEYMARFKTSFVVDAAPSNAIVRVAAFRSAAISVNRVKLQSPIRTGRNWKEPDVYQITGEIRPGANEIAVTVANSNAPPAVWLLLQADGLAVRSGKDWMSTYAGAVFSPSVVAGRVRSPEPGNMYMPPERPWESLRTTWPMLLLFLAISATIYVFVTRTRALPSSVTPVTPGCDTSTDDNNARPPKYIPGWLRNNETLCLGVLAILWTALFLNNIGALGSTVGFDAHAHLRNIDHIQRLHSLPKPADGFEAFQPPLYYLLSAGMLELVTSHGPHRGAVAALRVLGLGIGLIHFVIVWLALKLLFPQERANRICGLLLAASLPPLLYISQYVTNEGLAAMLASAAVYFALRVLNREKSSWKTEIALGVCIGLALLTKASALLVVPAIIGAIVWNGFNQGRPQASRSVATIIVVLGLAALICAWRYIGMWIHYGKPFLGNWDSESGFHYWLEDGYRTRGYYWRFGSVFLTPWHAAFRSFADGIYSSLWGDGALGGAAWLPERPPWNYRLMAVGFWLAVTPCLAVLSGGLISIGRFVRRPTPQWFLLLALAFTTAFALIHMSLVVPFFGETKAHYGLCALIPFCAMATAGFDRLARTFAIARPILWVLLLTWCLNSLSSFWVIRGSSAIDIAVATSPGASPGKALQISAIESLAKRIPEDVTVRASLLNLLMSERKYDEAAPHVQFLLDKDPPDPDVQLTIAAALEQQQRAREALDHARRAVQLAPGYAMAYGVLAVFSAEYQDYRGAEETARIGLRIDPGNARMRFAIGIVELMTGRQEAAYFSLASALALDSTIPQAPYLLASSLERLGRLDDQRYFNNFGSRSFTATLEFAAGALLLQHHQASAARTHLSNALRLDPDNAEAYFDLAAALQVEGDVTGAIAQYENGLRRSSNNAAALNNLAWILSVNRSDAIRDGARAETLARRACELTDFKQVISIVTLSAAQAEAGHFDEAVQTSQKACDLAAAGGQTNLFLGSTKLLKSFQQHVPWREPAVARKSPD